MKQKTKVILIILSIVFIVPLILELLIFRNKIFSPVSNDGWAGFFGAYIGAIIGAVTTYISVNLEIKNNEKIREEEIQREFKPYLYFSVDEFNMIKEIVYTYVYNFGKYAACDIKGYIVSNENIRLAWDQHLCIGGNDKVRIFIPFLSDDEYYIYEYKDVLGQKYKQVVRISGKNDKGIFDFYAEEPILIK